MKITLFAALLGLASALPGVRQVGNLDNPERIPGEFLIVLHPQVGKASNLAYASKIAGRIAHVSSKINVVKIFSNLQAPILYVKTPEEAVMSQLFAIDEVHIIESNVEQIMIEEDCSSQNSGSELWGLSRISNTDLPDDFDTAEFTYDSYNGDGVIAYILDTGIRQTHVDFTGRAEFGSNFIGGGDADIRGHGTHCAGTAVGAQYGVAKGATAVAVKVLNDSGSGTWVSIIAGIDWAVGDIQSRGGRGVISMSLGGSTNLATNSAVDSAVAAGLPVVTSAGNGNTNACTRSPAGAAGAIAVGNSNIQDSLSSTSNYGTCVVLIAPGTSIMSASHLDDNGTRTLSGTSMSCPHVTGAVARYLSQYPTASPAQVRQYLEDSATRDVINLRGVPDTPNLLLHSSCSQER